MDENAQKVSGLLHEAAETHHIVYRIVDGDDPDWASWYADWLLDHSELAEILGNNPVRAILFTRLSSWTATLLHKRCPANGKITTPISCSKNSQNRL
jgi:hypothetical protein